MGTFSQQIKDRIVTLLNLISILKISKSQTHPPTQFFAFRSLSFDIPTFQARLTQGISDRTITIIT